MHRQEHGERGTARRAAVPLPKPRPAEAPSAERDKPDEEQQASAPNGKPDRAGRARTAAHAAAIGLPAGADRRHRHCAQHPRHPWRRRLRGRGSGAAGGDRAAGQAAGFGEAGGDPALPHGVSAGRLDPQRYRAAGGSASAAPISDLDNFDSFECRGRNRVVGAKLSEHGRANALDVRAFKFANGQPISLTDRTVPRELRESVLHSACTRFSTVLGPGSDGYHEDHIHLDLMERRNNYRICQWNVWDPLPQKAPLLPAERPDEAPPREVAAKPDDAKSDAQADAKSDADEPDAAKSDAEKADEAEPPREEKPAKKKRRQNRRS